MNVQDLVSCIDPCTGQARMALTLLNRPGINGLDLSLSAVYGSGTLGCATTWNQDFPTGIMGLGWSLGRDGITALYQQSAQPCDAAYILSLRGISTPLACIAVAGDGSSSWAATGYQFWKITYYPAGELWVVIDENGITYRMGDSTSGADSVDWGVAWGGWTGPSGLAQNQRAVAVGWSLSRVSDLFGNCLTYAYVQTPVAIATSGGLNFTQAGYLSTVTGVDGAVMALSYLPKTADEYQNPHTNPVPPNGRQNRYETQYLSSAQLTASDGSALASVSLLYATDLGGGTLTKRVLTGLRRFSSNGVQTEPTLKLSYFGEGGGDGVSATTIFAGSALYGALKTITTPTGGTISYAYQQSAPDFAGRSLTGAQQAGWTSPVVYTCDEFTLISWLSGTNAVIQSYVWNGRWIESTMMQVPLANASAYASLKIAMGPDCVAALTGSTVMVAARDVTRSGAWHAAGSFTLSPALGAGEPATLVAGHHFAAVLGATSGNLFSFRFTGTGITAATIATAGGWVADTVTSLGATGSKFALGAKGSVMCTLAIPAGGAANFTMSQLTQAGSWSSHTSTLQLTSLASGTLGLVMGQGFAVAWSVVSQSGGSQQAATALWWNASGTQLSSQTLASQFVSTAPTVAGSTVVVGQMLYRFGGAGFSSFSSNSITYPNVSGTPVLSVGSDLVARLFTTNSNTAIADLLVYDPVGETWSVPAGLSISGSLAQLAAVAPNTSFAVANYAVIGTSLYYRACNGTWSSVLSLPAGLSSADRATIALSGQNYLVFQTGTGTATVQTQAYLLKNGGVASPAPAALGTQISGGSGTLVGRTAFAGYSGSYGSALTLYRPVFGGVAGAQTAYTVASITSNNGYGSEANVNGMQYSAFAYAGGTIDAGGTIPFFRTVTTVPGQTSTASTPNGNTVTAFYTGLTATEAPAGTYPSGPGNGPAFSLAMAGIPYQSTINSWNGTALAAVSQSTSFFTVTLLPLGSAGIGAYGRPVQQSDMLDGVTSTHSITYNTTIGLPQSTSTTVTNAAGTQDGFSRQYTYFYSQYDPSLSLNLLTPVIQTVEQSQPAGQASPATVGIQITTWKNWVTGTSQWAPERSYVALNAAASFTAWAAGQAPSTSDFQLVSQVLSVSGVGAVLTAANAQGVNSTNTYDQSNYLKVTSAANSLNQSVWYGCEPYESSGPWTSNAPGLSIANYITTADYHTGTQCIALPANSAATGPLLNLVPSDQTRRYAFSCWARTPSGFNPANGVAQWTISFYNPTSQASVGTSIALVLTPISGSPTAVGQWSYFQVTIDLPSLLTTYGATQLGFTILATNANTAQLCYMDELRFMPLDCAFGATVFDPTSLRPTAAINGNGQPSQLFYDDCDRPYLGVGPNGRVQGLAIATYSRWSGSTDGFNASVPNVTIAVGSAIGGVYYDFHDADVANWAFTPSASWTISGGVLSYTGSTSGTAACSLMTAPNQAARVSVAANGPAGSSVALGNGTYLMRWTVGSQPGQGSWTLEKSGQATALATNAGAPFDSDWLFAIIDNMIVCYAGSVQVFGYLPSTAPSTTSGQITLTATAAAVFDDLAIIQDPSLGLLALDGFGTGFTTLNLLGYQPTGTNVLFPNQWVIQQTPTFFDTLGRPYVKGQSLEAPLQVAPPAASATYNLIPIDQSTYLYSSTGSALAGVANYLSGTSGQTFEESLYEASPLGRPVSQDFPRGAYVTGTTYCTRQIIYGSSTTVGAAPTTAATGSYRVVTVKALQQTSQTPSQTATAVTVMSQTTYDSLGRVLAGQSGPVSGGSLLKTTYAYNAQGLLATLSPPNAFAPPGGTAAANWITSYGYSFLGQKISETTPDSGTTQWAYDSLGRVRFIYPAAGIPVAPSTTCTIIYVKYDALGRVVETGTMADANYAWGGAALTAKLNVAAFPQIVASPSGGNQAAGAKSKIITYDTDGSFSTAGASFTRFLIGQPATVDIVPTDGAGSNDTERYGYDAFGNMVSKTVVMPTLSPAAGWTTTTTYNAANQPLQITYPIMTATAGNPTPGGTAVQVGYGYDRLGRLSAVGGLPTSAVVDPLNPPSAQDMSYAGYSYNSLGQLSAVVYNNAGPGSAPATSYVYDANQRLQQIVSPYFQQTLSYNTTNTVSGWDYFKPAAADAQNSYIGSTQAPQPLTSYTQRWTYDGYGRLLTAAAGLSANLDITMGSGNSAGSDGYDANGNIISKTVGASRLAYGYTPPASQTTCNRVTSVATTATASADYTQVPPVTQGWTYKANNGITTSTITTANPVDGTTQVLKLAGGSAGHYEMLSLATFLTPGVSYTIGWSAATDAAYPTTPGRDANGACWYAVLNNAQGPVAVVPLATIAASPTSWTSGTTTLDLSPSGVTSLVGYFTEIVWVSLQLRNLCTGTDGTAGAAVYIKTAAAATSQTSPVASSYGYDADGNVSQATGRMLQTARYDLCSGLASSLSQGTSAADTTTQALCYSANNLRSRSTVTPPTGGVTVKTMTIYGPYGQRLATQTQAGSTVSATYYINGIDGPLAIQPSTGNVAYLIRDRLGSLRAIVDGPTGNLLSALGDSGFGTTVERSGTPATDLNFTGQRLDTLSGLYNYNARLYDPTLGRFYATDPAGQYPSPYAYCGNDPVNFIDPSGALRIIKWIGTAAALLLSMAATFPEFYRRHRDEDAKKWAKEWAEAETSSVFQKPRKAVAQMVKNVSPEEVETAYFHNMPPALGRIIGPFRLAATILFGYRNIPHDVTASGAWDTPPPGAVYIDLEKANAARHVSFVCRNMRLPLFFGSAGYALAIGDAHEGTPAAGNIEALLDGISDKLNNAITIYLVNTYPDKSCVDLFRDNWGSGPGIFSLNAEKQDWTNATRQEITFASFRNSMDFLERQGQALPHFSDEELEYIPRG